MMTLSPCIDNDNDNDSSNTSTSSSTSRSVNTSENNNNNNKNRFLRYHNKIYGLVMVLVWILILTFKTKAPQDTNDDDDDDESASTATGAALFHKNMNQPDCDDDKSLYKIANSDIFETKFDKKTVEYFEVETNLISTLYGQVHWRVHDNIALPDHIVSRFAATNNNNNNGSSKVMAVLGYEVDQVMEEQSSFSVDQNLLLPRRRRRRRRRRVPITWAYNHHYGAFLRNSNSVAKLQMRPVTNQDLKQHILGSHGHVVEAIFRNEYVASKMQPNDDEDEDIVYPQLQFFSEGNGGEMRASWHGYPNGYAQLIESPNVFSAVPMQIDIWDRQRMANTAKYVPGAPLPKGAYGSSGNNGVILPLYNGLLECPCSDRLQKLWTMTYAINDDDDDDESGPHKCTGQVQNATECWWAAQIVAPSPLVTHRQLPVYDASLPRGCSVRVVKPEARKDDNGDKFLLALDVVYNPNPQPNNYNTRTLDMNYGHVVDHNQEQNTVAKTAPLDIGQKSQLRIQPDYVAFGQGHANITVAMDTAVGMVRITLTGPADAWFGVGFGTQTMCRDMQADECPSGGPYALIVLGNVVQERKLDYHGPGRKIYSNITVGQNAVNAETNTRTVVIERKMKPFDHDIDNQDFYIFQDPSLINQDGSSNAIIPIITAKGCGGMEFAQHCGHGPASLVVIPTRQAVRICQTGIYGTIGGNHFTEVGRCLPFPTSDLARQQNPTCTLETYRGGLSCCRDGHSLLDKDQEQPWPNQELSYRLRFRFYFQEYTAPDSVASLGPGAAAAGSQKASHMSLVRLYHQTEANAGEYDIPPCPKGTPVSQCIHVITSQWKVRDMMVDCEMHDASWCTGLGSSNSTLTSGVELIYAGPHCHAGTCLSMELYNADTGELLCHVEPQYGQNSSRMYQEEQFLAIPPCLWSHNDPRLPNPQLLSLDTTLLSIKRNNNTFHHTGEMASWQMRGIVIPRKQGATRSDKDEKGNENYDSKNTVSLDETTSMMTTTFMIANDLQNEILEEEGVAATVRHHEQHRPVLRTKVNLVKDEPFKTGP